jgi:pimeloyl-ACP methyl ester carboxylesterase
VPAGPAGPCFRSATGLPLDIIEERFADFIEEVIDRTKLLPHYVEAGYADHPRVNLIGHSMGGLIITGYLERKGKSAPVSKVVTVGTPYHGSFEAVIKIATGTANLGSDTPRSSEREAARLTSSLYHLLPAIKHGLEVDDPSLPASLFDPALWQLSIIASVLSYVRKQMAFVTEKEEKAQALFVRFLEAAQAYRTRIDNFQLSQTGLSRKTGYVWWA